MHILPRGATVLDTKGELYYHLLLEMGLGIDRNQHIYDQTTGDTLSFKDKYIKCAVNNQPIYAGKDEVIFSIDENWSLFMSIFAHFLDTLANDNDSDIEVVSHYTTLEQDLEKTRLFVNYHKKSDGTSGQIVTNLFFDPWICYVEMIFLLNGNITFDFANFDHKPEKK